MPTVNPFNKDGEYGPKNVVVYKFLTILSWLLVVITSIYYAFARPREGHSKSDRHRIWQHQPHTPFAMNEIIVSIYWIVLYVMQTGYVVHFWHKEEVYVKAAANVGAHFVAHNLFLFGFIMLWCRSYYYWAELLLIVNFFNLSSAYFRHSTTPRFIHIPVVSGPLAWNFVALYWCGAAAVNAHTLPARIVANIFIWGIGAYGMFFLVAFKDYTMGINLSVLAAGKFAGSYNSETSFVRERH